MDDDHDLDADPGAGAEGGGVGDAGQKTRKEVTALDDDGDVIDLTSDEEVPAAKRLKTGDDEDEDDEGEMANREDAYKAHLRASASYDKSK